MDRVAGGGLTSPEKSWKPPENNNQYKVPRIAPINGISIHGSAKWGMLQDRFPTATMATVAGGSGGRRKMVKLAGNTYPAINSHGKEGEDWGHLIDS